MESSSENSNKLCPICDTENKDIARPCSECGLSLVESQNDFELNSSFIKWAKKTWQNLLSEKKNNEEIQKKLYKDVIEENQNQSSVPHVRIEQISEPLTTLAQEIKSLTKEINSLRQQIPLANFQLEQSIEKQDNLNNDNLDTHSDINDSRDLLEKNKCDISYSENEIESDSSPEIPNDNSDLNSSPRFVEEYNRDKHSLFNKAIATVTETEESMNNRRDGKSIPLQLEIKSSQGNYWIINEDGSDYLVPKSDIKINEFNFKTIAVLFECNNGFDNYSFFQLLKPAKISKISSNLWQLEEKGELDFSKSVE